MKLRSVRRLVARLLDSHTITVSSTSLHRDAWSCVFCSGVLVEPVTMSCGHCSCETCLQQDQGRVCRACRRKYSPARERSVTVKSLVSKYWGRELEAARLRAEGNALYQGGSVQDSIKKYDEALKICPDDHLCLSNRANALYQDRQYSNSLADADRAASLKPDWNKSYLRKAMALAALHRDEEAVVAYFQYFVLSGKRSKALEMKIARSAYLIIKRAESSQTRLGEVKLEASDGESDSEAGPEVLSSSAESKVAEMVHKIKVGVKKVQALVCSQSQRSINPEAVSEDDFECTLCTGLLWEPITTPCGHTYCRACLDIIQDYTSSLNPVLCPICRVSISDFQTSNTGVTEFIEATLKQMLPDEYHRREEEIKNNLLGSQDDGSEIPVFVCTMSYPQVSCRLHVFEPRYRLMLRRTLESGARQFGMCVKTPRTEGFSDYGTMLEIRDVRLNDDGTSEVDTLGGKVFRVLRRGNRDGYDTARVEFLQDEAVEEDELEGLKVTHEQVFSMAEVWFSKIDTGTRRVILSHFGDLPRLEAEYWALGAGPAWCWWLLAILQPEQAVHQQILSLTSLRERLRIIQRILWKIL